jgi:hypothetical protein
MSKRERQRTDVSIGVPKVRPAIQISVQLLLLAATDRAVRHQARPHHGAPAWPGRDVSTAPAFLISEHLGYSPGTTLRRRLRNGLDELTRDGLLEARREAGRPAWCLTEKGKKRLAHCRRRAWDELPESPQHRRWREAHETAAQQIEALNACASCALEAAATLLEGDTQDSAELAEMGDRLRDVFRRLAAASYCLFEWMEPDDMRADIDIQVPSRSLRNPANGTVSAS